MKGINKAAAGLAGTSVDHWADQPGEGMWKTNGQGVPSMCCMFYKDADHTDVFANNVQYILYNCRTLFQYTILFVISNYVFSSVQYWNS